MCRRNMLLQLVAGPVYTEWFVAATCYCNLSPSVYRPYNPIWYGRRAGAKARDYSLLVKAIRHSVNITLVNTNLNIHLTNDGSFFSFNGMRTQENAAVGGCFNRPVAECLDSAVHRLRRL